MHTHTFRQNTHIKLNSNKKMKVRGVMPEEARCPGSSSGLHTLVHAHTQTLMAKYVLSASLFLYLSALSLSLLQ